MWQVDFNFFRVLVFQFLLLVLVIISMIESNEKCNCEGSFWTSEFVCFWKVKHNSWTRLVCMFSLIISPALSFTRRMQVLINALYGLLFQIYRPMSCIAWRDGYTIQSIISTQTNKKNHWPAWSNQMKKKKKRCINNLRPRSKGGQADVQLLIRLKKKMSPKW